MAKNLKISESGLQLLKKFEGCRLVAYWDVNGYSIGYGHHGADVTQGMKITQKEAEEYLKKDVAKFEKAVNALKYDLNQNQFDALVDFAYNCGAGNLKKLTADNTRTLREISGKLTAYCKANGVALAGLVNRRRAEKALFDKPVEDPGASYIICPHCGGKIYGNS